MVAEQCTKIRNGLYDASLQRQMLTVSNRNGYGCKVREIENTQFEELRFQMLIGMIHESKVETLKDPGVKLGRNCLGFSCPLRRGRSKVIAMKEALKTTYELEVLHE